MSVPMYIEELMLEKWQYDYKKFEDAVRKFGSNCIDLKANNRTFETWLIHYLIKEFKGTERVYQNLQFEKEIVNALLSRASSRYWHNTLDESIDDFINTPFIYNGRLNLSSTIAIKKEDAYRHIKANITRNEADWILDNKICANVKITAAKSKKNKYAEIKSDILSLLNLTLAFKMAQKIKKSDDHFAAYLILLNNVASSSINEDKMAEILSDIEQEIELHNNMLEIGEVIRIVDQDKPVIMIINPTEIVTIDEFKRNSFKELFISESKALERAKYYVPDLENRQYYEIVKGPPQNVYVDLGWVPPKNVWTIYYSKHLKDNQSWCSHASYAILIDWDTGQLIFNGCLNDEG